MKTKKHKVEIPKGYEVESTSSFDHYGNDRLIMTTTFKPIKKELPKTWEEYCKANQSPNWLFNYDTPKRYIALAKLEALRDVYNDGIKMTSPYSIYRLGDGIGATNDIRIGPLVLNNTELGIEFIKNFRDIIETAKPLL